MSKTRATSVENRPVRPLLRYFQAASGPIATAVAHFALSIVLLHGVTPSVFGKLSFMLIASQLGAGVWGALFCAPLPVMLAQARNAGNGDEDRIRRCIEASNLFGACTALVVFWSLAYTVGLGVIDGGLFAGYCAVYLLRWFAKANSYVAQRPLAALSSDLVYSSVLLVVLGTMTVWTALLTTRSVCIALLLAAIVSLAPFGAVYLRSQFAAVSLKHTRGYPGIWRQHSGWSLAGVVTTEATANSHAYLLTMFAGPGAFAPIAASALLIRPIGVFVNALTEMERPSIARLLGQGDHAGAFHTLRLFRTIMLVTWLLGAGLAVLILAYVPGLVFPSTYTFRFLVIGTSLWMLVMFARQWRAPDSVLLQAAGDFRTLARASMLSACSSIVAVASLLAALEPVWSIGGIVVGETICTLWTWRQAQRHRSVLADGNSVENTFAPSVPKQLRNMGVNFSMEKK
jgi:hypothetical protein